MNLPDAIPRDMAAKGWHLHRATDGPFTQFQVLGERGCGTNVVRKTISKSLRIERTEGLGWKHGFPTMAAIPEGLVVVCAFRNAFDWANSLYKRPWHAYAARQSLGFPDFLRAPWHGVVDRTGDFEAIHPEIHVDGQELQYDRHPITGEAFADIFALRSAKAAALLGMVNRGCSVAFVQLEALNAHPRGFVGALAETFALDPTERGYRPITRNMGNRFRPSVPDRAPVPDPWPDTDRAFALSRLDPAVETAMGYRYDQA